MPPLVLWLAVPRVRFVGGGDGNNTTNALHRSMEDASHGLSELAGLRLVAVSLGHDAAASGVRLRFPSIYIALLTKLGHDSKDPSQLLVFGDRA